MTSVYLALHGNEVLSVTTESVYLDLTMRRYIPCYFFGLCLAVWLCLKMGYKNRVLARLLQIGATDLTVSYRFYSLHSIIMYSFFNDIPWNHV